MGFFDSVGDFLGGAVGAVKNNKSWLEPVANLAYGAYSSKQAEKAQDKMLDYYRDREERNYQQYLAEQEYELARAAAGGGGGGGGGGGSGGLSPDQLTQIMNAQLERIRAAQALYQPYHDSAMKVLPQMTSMYGSGIQGLNQLAARTVTPEKAAKAASTPISPFQVGVPLPKHMTGGR